MRALVVLVHYFSPERNPRHSSVDEAKRASRTTALEQVISSYRGLFGPSGKLTFPNGTLLVSNSKIQIDIQLVTVEGCSLLTKVFQKKYQVGQNFCLPKNPRELGFFAHKVLANAIEDYDWFIYSEDDLLVSDQQFFDKLIWFNSIFGDSRVMSPNRYEWNLSAALPKIYVDGDISQATFERLTQNHPDNATLEAEVLGKALAFKRARNPHSGFFALSKSQLQSWIAKPFWLDLDVSFVSPLESAATLGLTKQFAVFKSEPSLDFFQIEHLDKRFSSIGRLPLE